MKPIQILPAWVATLAVLISAHAQNRFQFAPTPTQVVAGVPFVQEVQVVTPGSLIDTAVTTNLLLEAYQRLPAPLQISEVAGDGEAIEVVNPGADPLALAGWSLEWISSRPDLDPLLQPLPSVTLPPGGRLVWTSQDREFPQALRLLSEVAFNTPPRRASVFQIRNPGGQLVDQVRIAESPLPYSERLWSGAALKRVGAAHWERRGTGNHFNASDWETSGQSLGEPNPQLTLPWKGPRRPIPVTPTSIPIVQGLWEGSVTVTTAGPEILLAVAQPGRPRVESAPFRVWPVAPLPGTQTLPQLALEAVGAESSRREAEPEAFAVRVSSLTPLTAPLRVTFNTDAASEVSLPAEVLLPANPPYQATVTLTNLNDLAADGHARVTVRAEAPGFLPGTWSFVNEDDEALPLYLLLPDTVAEGSGDQTIGQVVLDAPTTHAVEVRLRADGPLRVPATVLIPAGQSAAPIGWFAEDDSLVNRRQPSATITASASAATTSVGLQIQNDDVEGLSVEWPSEIVEGQTHTAWIVLRSGYDVETTFRLQSNTDRFQVPPTVTVPAGVSRVPLTFVCPNNTAVDGPFFGEVCVLLEDRLANCRYLYGADDEVAPIDDLTPVAPAVLLSGEPFLFEALARRNLAVQRTNLLGQLTVEADPSLASLVPDPNPVAFTNGVLRESLTLRGEGLGLRLSLRAGGLTNTTAPFDLLHGFVRTNAMLDLALFPGRGTLLLSVGTATNATGELQELDPQTGTVLRSLTLPRPGTRLAVAADGTVAWLASPSETLQRVDLNLWRFDRQLPLGPYASNRSAVALAVLPGGSERLVTLEHPLAPDGSEPLLVAYEGGVRRTNTPIISSGTSLNDLLPGRTPTEAYLSTYSVLARLRVTESGVELQEQGPGLGGGSPNPNVALAGDHLYTASGRVYSADTLALVLEAPVDSWNFYQVVPLPDRGLLGFVYANSEFRLLDATTFERRSHHGLPSLSWPGSGTPGRLIRSGPSQFALLTSQGQTLLVWQSPQLAQPTADLAITVQAPAELSASVLPSLSFQIPWTVQITNRGPGIAHRVVVSSEQGQPSELGSLAPGEFREVIQKRGSVPVGFVRDRLTVASATPDSQPADNTQIVETRIVPATFGETRGLVLYLHHLVGMPDSNRLALALGRLPNTETPGLALLHAPTATFERTRTLETIPTRLAPTSDGLAIWALTATNRIVRWNLTTDQLDASLEVTNDVVLDLLAIPGEPDGLAIATQRGFGVYRQGVRVAGATLPVSEVRNLAWAGNRLWVSYPDQLRGYTVTGSGLTAYGSPIDLPPGAGFGRIGGDNDRLYFFNAVVEIASRQLRPGLPGNEFVADPSRDAIYGIQGYSVFRYNRSSLQREAEEVIPAGYSPSYNDLVRWGPAGLAARSDQQLILWQSSSVPEGQADLTVGLQLPEFLVPFEPIAVTLSVTNLGTETAARVRLQLQAPNAQVTSLTPPSAFTRLDSYFLEVPELPAGGVTNLTAVFQTFSSFFSVHGGVTSAARDPNPHNNQLTFSVPVQYPTADLAILQVEAPEEVPLGSEFTIRVVLTNQGPGTVTLTSVDLTKNPGYELLDVSGATLNPDCCTGIYFSYTRTPLEPGAQRTVDFRFRATQAGAWPYTSQGSGSVNDLAGGNNTSNGLLIVRPPEGSPFPLRGGSAQWSEARQQWVVNLGGWLGLFTRDLQWIRRLSVPYGFNPFIISEDGTFLWAVGPERRLIRLNLNTDVPFASFTTDEDVAFAGGLAFLPGEPDSIVVAGLAPNGVPQVTIYDSGQPRLARYSGVNWAGAGLFLSTVQSNRVYLNTGSSLRELALGPGGVAQIRDLDSVTGYPNRYFQLVGDQLYHGTGTVTDLTRESRDDTGIAFADPVSQLGYQVQLSSTFGPAVLSVRAFDLLTLEPRWRQEQQVTNAQLTGVITGGSWGVLTLGDQSRLFRNPAPETRSVDLAMSVAPLTPPAGTNQTLTLQLSVTNRSPWTSFGTTVKIDFSEGLQPLEAAERSLTLNLGTVVTNAVVEVPFRTIAAGVQQIQIQAQSDLTESQPADNQQLVTLTVPESPRFILGDSAVAEGAQGFPGRIFASLSTPAPGPLEVVFQPQLLTAQANDLPVGPIVFRFSPGLRTSSAIVAQGDSVLEANETYRLRFVSGGVQPIQSSPLVTLLNDDFAELVPATLNIAEGQSGWTEARLPVRLTQTSSLPVEVSFRLASGTALAGSDFLAQSGRLRFEPGQRTNAVIIPIRGDTDFEPGETIQVLFDDPWGGALSTASTLLTITNDDVPPVPQLTLEAVGNGLQLRFSTALGAQYRLQSRTNLTRGTWTTEAPAWNGGAEVVHPLLTPPAPQTWYRVLAQ